MEKEEIENEVKVQFDQLVSAINRLDAGAWSEYYSEDAFISSIAITDYYATRSEWVELITNYFSMRERQHLEPLKVHVTALTPDIALMTSEQMAEMRLKNGDDIKCKHVYTMIWKREPSGWKILHSHESWMDK